MRTLASLVAAGFWVVAAVGCGTAPNAKDLQEQEATIVPSQQPEAAAPARRAVCKVRYDKDHGGWICARGNCETFACNPHTLADGRVINVVKCYCH
jgi:hypothetical protein